MRQARLAPEGIAIRTDETVEPARDDLRLRRLVDGHYDFVWRSLRRLGVLGGDVDDATQRVFLIAARRLGDVRPEAERSFLFQSAVRVAADSRRTQRRRHEVPADEAGDRPDPSPNAEELLDARQARRELDRVLDSLPMELRLVFTLFELEELTMAEIATLLELPQGTVASRLRRARESFRDEVARAQSRRKSGKNDR